MDDAVLTIARRGETNEPLIINVYMARRLNTILGGPFFGPWDIPDLPGDTLDTILSIETVSEARAGYEKVQSSFARWREDNARVKH